MPGQILTLPTARSAGPSPSEGRPGDPRRLLGRRGPAPRPCLPADQRLLAWPLSYLGLEFLAAASLGYRAWRTTGASRLAWWLLTISAALEVPNLIVSLLLSRGWTAPWAAGLPSLLGLGTGLLVLAGVLSFPRAQESSGVLWRRIQDGLIFAVSVLFLLWVMGVQGNLRAAAHGMGFRVFVAYLNAALLGGGLVFMTSY